MKVPFFQRNTRNALYFAIKPFALLTSLPDRVGGELQIVLSRDGVTRHTNIHLNIHVNYRRLARRSCTEADGCHRLLSISLLCSYHRSMQSGFCINDFKKKFSIFYGRLDL